MLTDDETDAEFDRIFETTRYAQNPGYLKHNIGSRTGIQKVIEGRSKRPRWKRQLSHVRVGAKHDERQR